MQESDGADRDSEEAFAMLITRRVNKLHSVALCHTGNPHQTEEATQLHSPCACGHNMCFLIETIRFVIPSNKEETGNNAVSNQY